jgi:hypothetical protein
MRSPHDRACVRHWNPALLTASSPLMSVCGGHGVRNAVKCPNNGRSIFYNDISPVTVALEVVN